MNRIERTGGRWEPQKVPNKGAFWTPLWHINEDIPLGGLPWRFTRRANAVVATLLGKRFYGLNINPGRGRGGIVKVVDPDLFTNAGQVRRILTQNAARRGGMVGLGGPIAESLLWIEHPIDEQTERFLRGGAESDMRRVRLSQSALLAVK